MFPIFLGRTETNTDDSVQVEVEYAPDGLAPTEKTVIAEDAVERQGMQDGQQDLPATHSRDYTEYERLIIASYVDEIARSNKAFEVYVRSHDKLLSDLKSDLLLEDFEGHST